MLVHKFDIDTVSQLLYAYVSGQWEQAHGENLQVLVAVNQHDALPLAAGAAVQVLGSVLMAGLYKSHILISSSCTTCCCISPDSPHDLLSNVHHRLIAIPEFYTCFQQLGLTLLLNCTLIYPIFSHFTPTSRFR